MILYLSAVEKSLYLSSTLFLYAAIKSSNSLLILGSVQILNASFAVFNALSKKPFLAYAFAKLRWANTCFGFITIANL